MSSRGVDRFPSNPAISRDWRADGLAQTLAQAAGYQQQGDLAQAE
jgi:hypothetical protein